MAKIKIDNGLLERAASASEAAGYSSVEEFVAHLIEKELAQSGSDEAGEAEQQVADRLRGLGYID
jgi:hypothetical protein